ncbi:MAG: LysM peptidoglycan-binding domain-containing protein [Longimicrobiales bacterium]|nr:LysM peptidoglycan-binding domain-containing protein [Longimicrobiales bacterium]
MVRSKVAVAALPLILGLAVALPGDVEAQQDTPAQEAEGRHLVERGESLWNLARQYYDDPFQWRRIYEANVDRIEDPHWIYPGQRFLVPGVGMVTVGGVEVDGQPGDVQAGGGAAAGAPGDDVAFGRVYPGPNERTVFSQPPRTDISPPDDRTAFFGPLMRGGVVDERGGVLAAEETPYLEVSEDAFYSSPWTASREGPESELYPGEVLGWAGARAETQERLDATIQVFDEIRLVWRATRIPPEGTVVQLARVVRSSSELGRIVQPTAVARIVERVDSTVIAIVRDVYDRPRAGDLALLAPSFDLEPGQYAEEATGELTAPLRGYARDRLIQQIGDIGFLSVGSEQGVSVGDVFAVETDGDMAFTMQVVRVFENEATARIRDVRVASFPSDATVRRIRQMP